MPPQAPKSQSRILTPAVAFAICLILTIGASYYAHRNATFENAARYDRTINTFRETLRNRVAIYTNALLYTRNLYNVKPDLTEAEFRHFVQEMKLKENFPGILSVGYVERLNLDEAALWLRELGKDLEHARIPEGRTHGDFIRYVERLNDEIYTIQGFDLSASPERKAAMDQSVDSGEAVASERVLPLDPKAPRIYAFSVFVPVYRVGMPVNSVEERRAALKGFVTGGFRAPNLFGQITDAARFRASNFFVQIFDGPTLDPANLMYQEGDRASSDASMLREFQFSFANHTWTARVIAPPGFSIPSLRYTWMLIAGMGSLLSILVAVALSRSQRFTRRLQDDIESRRQAERLMNEARNEAEAANAAKSMFLANISHEIRTPLGVMIGFTEMALTQDDAKERAESLRFVVRNGKELTRIIGDVLDVSKIEAQTLDLEKVAFSLQNMIDDLVQIWRPQILAKNLKFKIEMAQGLPAQICSDETRIKQVLTNLLSNAVKFTTTGSISLIVSRAAWANGGGDSEDRDNQVLLNFAIDDSGIGISKEQQDRLFKPFAQADSSITRKYGGSGLGLALSRAIAQTMGGELLLSSYGKSHGSRFTFTVPVDLELREAATPAQAFAAAPTLIGKRILLVDDSADNRALVSRILKKAEADVDTAVDGEDALQQALKTSYDLILMDIQMPVKDGYTAFRELREVHHSKVPVIALTAHALVAERDKALGMGFSDYVTKPVDAKTLVQVSAQSIGV